MHALGNAHSFHRGEHQCQDAPRNPCTHTHTHTPTFPAARAGPRSRAALAAPASRRGGPPRRAFRRAAASAQGALRRWLGYGSGFEFARLSTHWYSLSLKTLSVSRFTLTSNVCILYAHAKSPPVQFVRLPRSLKLCLRPRLGPSVCGNVDVRQGRPGAWNACALERRRSFSKQQMQMRIERDVCLSKEQRHRPLQNQPARLAIL